MTLPYRFAVDQRVRVRGRGGGRHPPRRKAPAER